MKIGEIIMVIMKRTIVNIPLVIFSIIILYSCSYKNDKILLKNNEIELLKVDYQIVNYEETETTFYENGIQMNLKIKITNPKKIILLNNLIDPIIHLEFNNKKYLAKGLFVLSSGVPPNCDYFFAIDENKKILLSEDKIMSLTGFEYR
ncbi:MAG: hypothetical protein LBI28_00515 [Treponema sp.]|jgi:hypothetical protein|nr:hypothetical protein [Treponema sp.]